MRRRSARGQMPEGLISSNSRLLHLASDSGHDRPCCARCGTARSVSSFGLRLHESPKWSIGKLKLAICARPEPRAGFLFDRYDRTTARGAPRGRPGHRQGGHKGRCGRKSLPLFPLMLIVICGSFAALRRCLYTRNFPRRCGFSLFFTMGRLALHERHGSGSVLDRASCFRPVFSGTHGEGERSTVSRNQQECPAADPPPGFHRIRHYGLFARRPAPTTSRAPASCSYRHPIDRDRIGGAHGASGLLQVCRHCMAQTALPGRSIAFGLYFQSGYAWSAPQK
jgi:hypothetical protein